MQHKQDYIDKGKQQESLNKKEYMYNEDNVLLKIS